MTTRKHKGLVVSGWDLLSLFGMGKDALRAAMRNGGKARSVLAREGSGNPPVPGACMVPAFDIKTALPGKGTRSFDRQTGLFLAATGLAISDCGLELSPQSTGIIQCTSTGSVKSIMDFCRDTFVHARPYLVEPSLFPNTVLNCAAGQCAIRLKLKGPNLTISGGHVSFYSALGYTRRWLTNNYAAVVLAGAVEEVSEQSAWAYVHTTSQSHRLAAPLSEACAVFVLEPESDLSRQNGLPRVLATEARCFFGSQPLDREGRRSGDSLAAQAEGLASVIRRCLEQSAVDADDVGLVCSRTAGVGRLAGTESAGIEQALGSGGAREIVALNEWVGETYSAVGAMQLALILTRLETMPARYALATAVADNGTVGCMVIEKGRPA